MNTSNSLEQQLKKLKEEYKKEMVNGNTRNAYFLTLEIHEVERALGLPLSNI